MTSAVVAKPSKPSMFAARPVVRRGTVPTVAGAVRRGSQAVSREGNHGKLRLFLDTADREQWKSWMPTGIFYGVTTNPTLLERAGEQCTLANLKGLAQEGFDLGCEEVQLQTWGGTADSFTEIGEKLAGLDRRVVVKIPISREGIVAADRLIGMGARVTMTGLYKPHQALSAAGVGADYAAPYLGRMTDQGQDGQADVIKMQRVVDAAAHSGMRILVASLRDPAEIADLAAQGLDTFTFSPVVAEMMFSEELTINAAAAFEDAAVKMGATNAV